jgi:hypothetical protein
MNRRTWSDLVDELSDRDLAILATLRAHRIASTAQLRRLHFVEPFASPAAATRSTQRVLLRLEGHGLIARLTRRIGGVRKGSASIAWHLAAAGERLLARTEGGKPRKWVEPSTAFAAHSLAVTELAVRLREAVRAGDLESASIEAEPKNWRSFLGQHGRREILKPDLTAVTVTGEFEDHWYLERDMGTEHPPVVARKALVYERYAATGEHQAAHGVLPVVLWVVPSQSRAVALERALRRTPRLTPGSHRVTTLDGFLPTVLAGSEPTDDVLNSATN